MNVLDHLGCDKVFYYFEAISDIPHGSFHEKELSDYIVAFAKERKVKAVGHEPADTDPGVIACTEGYVGEYYILDQECYQVELMINLDQVPPVGSLIFVGFPKAKDSPGFTARCIALCPKE